MKITVIGKQNLLDVALQEYGDVRSVFDVALSNNISITDELFAGMELSMPDSVFDSKEVKNYFLGKNRKVSTAYELSGIALREYLLTTTFPTI